MANKYPVIEEAHEMACEPSVAYACAEREMATETGFLPTDIVRAAVECAIIERREGTLISSDDILPSVYEELGWK